MADILRFEFNVAEEIALKYPTGREVEGRYGPQVMYTLTDSRIMYLDPNVAAKITDMSIGAGECFTIVKREKKDGRKKGAEYVIQRVEEAPPETQQAPPLVMTAPVLAAPARNGHTARPSTASPNDTAPHDTLSVLFRASIDTLADATRYGAAKGWKLEFNEEDVRTLAISMFINVSRGQAWQR